MGKASRNKKLRLTRNNAQPIPQKNNGGINAENTPLNLRTQVAPQICNLCGNTQLFADYHAPHFAPQQLAVPYTCQACGRGEQKSVPNFWKVQALVAVQEALETHPCGAR